MSTSPQGGALSRGLAVLKCLVTASGPISATAIAAATDMHQSSASRILASLASDGYVRRKGQLYEPDYGLLSLSTSAVRRFALATKPYLVMETAARDCPGHTFSLAALWQNDIIYFLRFSATQEPVLFSAPAFPLHLSAPALRLLHQVPRAEAEDALERSRATHGWERPTSRVPESTKELLDLTGELITDDCLVLSAWSSPHAVTAALALDLPGEAPTCLTVAGPVGMSSSPQLTAWLHGYGELVVQSMTA